MPVPLSIAKIGRYFHEIYGMTECLGGTALKAHDHRIEGRRRGRRLASAGQPLFGNEGKFSARTAELR